MSIQAGIPVDVTVREIEREKTLGGAIGLCAKAAGFELDKELQRELNVDKAQFSRWLSGQEGIVWPKLSQLMLVCGNDAPVLWMLHQIGYDLNSLRKRETETERRLREAMEEIAALRNERDVTLRVLREIKAA
jgi:plasmid maintenance system antidote protein VapI